MVPMDHAPSTTPGQRRQLATLYAIFLVSGFCGLIYESIWSHYLKLLLGHAAYAQAVVLVVFVGGLAIGAWLTGRVSERIRQPILWYAVVEAAVAVMAFTFQAVFEAASAWATQQFLPAMCGEVGPCGAVWLLAAALILPPSILLGTTFPLMSAGVMRLGAQPGRGLSLLYFLNSAGAAAGVLASGFLLIPALGLPGTILLAGACNALVALAAYGTVAAAGKNERAAQAPASVPRPQQPPGPLRLLLVVAALTGLSSFIYEVVWIRMLTLVFGAATHAFELMLAPFIFGLALGAWWIRNRIDGSRDAMLLLAKIQIVMGLLAVATLPLYASTFDAMAWALRALSRTEQGYALFNIASISMAAAVMLPATICAGMTLPLVTALLLRRGDGERQVGQVYGVNTLGAIAGVLLAVHVLIPTLGLKWALAAGAAIDIALALAIWRMVQVREAGNSVSPGPRHYPRAVLAGVAALSLALLVGVTQLAPLGADRMASGVFRHGMARIDADASRVLLHADGKTATITVLERRNGLRSLLTNGKSDGASHPNGKVLSADDNTMVLLGALGPAHHPGARKAAVIGLGTGTTSAVLLGSPTIEQLDTIEIEPMMVEAAQLFRPRVAAVFDDPRSRIVIDDARAHFAKTRARYDLVVSEPSNPWVSGVSGLFTLEFYQHVSLHLAPDGHFVQWLHLYEAGPETAASILRAFSMVFPDFKAYATNDGDIALVARKGGKAPKLQAGALDAMPAIQQHLLSLGITSEAALAAHESGRGNAILVLANSFGAPPNSDYFPFVDQHAAQDRFRGRRATTLFSLREAPLPFMDFAAGAPDHAGRVTEATVDMPRHVRNLASGWHGHRFLRGEPLTAVEAAYLGALATDYALVRSWITDCRFPTGTGQAWTAMVNVASDLHAGLDAKRAETLWRGIASGPCARKLSPVQMAWVELFAATGARKAEPAAVHARNVLALDQDLSIAARSYATLAGVSADLSLHRRAAAARLLDEQRRLLPAPQMETAWFRYLVFAMAARQERPAP